MHKVYMQLEFIIAHTDQSDLVWKPHFSLLFFFFWPRHFFLFETPFLKNRRLSIESQFLLKEHFFFTPVMWNSTWSCSRGTHYGALRAVTRGYLPALPAPSSRNLAASCSASYILQRAQDRRNRKICCLQLKPQMVQCWNLSILSQTA